MEGYFVIMCSEDGEPSTHFYESEEKLLNDLNENYFGEVSFKDSLPDSDMFYWGKSLLIIKGKVVTPKAVETVTKLKF
jgi:hypothetical protein